VDMLWVAVKAHQLVAASHNPGQWFRDSRNCSAAQRN
jgi:hypothetical protein